MISRSARRDNTAQLVRKHKPDYGLFIIAAVLLSIGLIVMYAISPALAAQGGNVSENYFVIRQLIAVVFGIVAFYVFSVVPYEKWAKFHKVLIGGAIFASIVAIALGGIGSRWLQFSSMSFQTVEFVKLAVIISFAGFLASRHGEGTVGSLRDWRWPMIVAAILALIVVGLQKDLGSAVVLFSIVLAMLFMAGIPLGKIALVGLLVGAVGVAAIVSTPYRRDRVSTFLNPTADCSDEGYHSCQALIAVGSGGLIGVGLGRSVQAYGYLPEAENDSIFAIYAEKFGFIGTVVLIALYGMLLLRILTIAQRAPNAQMQFATIGVLTWFTVQGSINIAAMLGLIPLKGITLPFISYGGTSLIFSMAALGLVFHVSKYTQMRKAYYYNALEKGGSHENSAYGRRNGRPRYTTTRRSL